MIELDHLFVVVTPGAPEIAGLLALGLHEGTPNTHPGQGTANRRIFFANAMLELLWLADATEAQSPAIQPTLLFERCSRSQPEHCPFGICIRTTGSNPVGLPFPTWHYRPPYLPAELSIPMAHNAALLAEPLIFATPWGGRPDQAPPERRQPLNHPSGIRELTRVVLETPFSHPRSDALAALIAAGVLEEVPAAQHRLHLTFDHGRQGRSQSLAPVLPLTLSW